MDRIPIDSVGAQYPNEMIAGGVHVTVFRVNQWLVLVMYALMAKQC